MGCFADISNVEAVLCYLFALVAIIILFGGLVAPVVSPCASFPYLGLMFVSFIEQALTMDFGALTITSEQLELKLGMGGTSYEDFIRQMHLPLQLRYTSWVPSETDCLLVKLKLKLKLNSHRQLLILDWCGGAAKWIQSSPRFREVRWEWYRRSWLWRLTMWSSKSTSVVVIVTEQVCIICNHFTSSFMR